MSDTTRPALRHTRGSAPRPVRGGSLFPGLDSCLEDLSSWKPFTGEEGGAELARSRCHGTGSGPSAIDLTGGGVGFTFNREALAGRSTPGGAAQGDTGADLGPKSGLLRQACKASQSLLLRDGQGLAQESLGSISQGSPAHRRTALQSEIAHGGVPSSLQQHLPSRQKSSSPRQKAASDAVPSGQSVPTPLPPSSPRPQHQPHHRGSRSSAVPRFLSQRGSKHHLGQWDPESSAQLQGSQARDGGTLRPWCDVLYDSAQRGGEGLSQGTGLVTRLSSERKNNPLFSRIRLPGERRPKGGKDGGNALRKLDTDRKHNPHAAFGTLEPLQCALSSDDEAVNTASTRPGSPLHNEAAGRLPVSPADITIATTSPGGTAGKLTLEETDVVFDGMDASREQKPQVGDLGPLDRAEQPLQTMEEAGQPRAAIEPPSNLMDVFLEGSARHGEAGPGLWRRGIQELGAMTARTVTARSQQLPGTSAEAVGSDQQGEKGFRFGQPPSIPLNWRFFVSDPASTEARKADGSRALFLGWPDRSQAQTPASSSALRVPRRAGVRRARARPPAAAQGQGLASGALGQATAVNSPSLSQGYLPTGSKRANTEVAEDMSPGSSYEAEVSDYSEEERAERQRTAGMEAGLASAGPGLGLRNLDGLPTATSSGLKDAVPGSEGGGDLPTAGAPRGAPGEAPTLQMRGLDEGLWQGMSFSQGTPRRPHRTGHQPRKRRRYHAGGYTSSEGLSVQGSERLGMAYASDPATDHASHGREARLPRRGLPHGPGSSSGGADQAYYYTRSRSGRAREAARRRGGGAGSRGTVRGSGGYISSSSTGLDLPQSRHRLRSEQWYAMNWQSGAESECGSDVGYGGDGELGEGCEEDPIEEGDENAGDAARPAYAPGSQHRSSPKAQVGAQASLGGGTGPGLVKKLRWPRPGEKEKEKERGPEGPAASAQHVRRRMHLLDQVREGHSGPEAAPAAGGERGASDAREDATQRRWRLPSRIIPGEGASVAAPPAVPPRLEPFPRAPGTFETVAEALRPSTFRSNSAIGASERESSGPSFTVRGGRGIRRACRPTRMRRKRRSSRNFGAQPSEAAAGPFPEFDPWQRGADFATPGIGPFSLGPWTAFDGPRPFKAFGRGGGSGYEQEEDGEGESGRESLLGQGGSELRDTPNS